MDKTDTSATNADPRRLEPGGSRRPRGYGSARTRRFVVLASLFLSTSAWGVDLADSVREGGNLGIGLGGGTAVSGLSGKYFLSDAFSIQAVVGGGGYSQHDYYWNGQRNAYGHAALGINFDVLWELPALATAADVFELGLAVGFGGWTWIGDPLWLGANGVVGLEFNLIAVPIDIVLEYQPALLLVPGLGFDPVNFGGHIRLYFH